MPNTPLLSRTETEHTGSNNFDDADADENTPLLANAGGLTIPASDPNTASAVAENNPNGNTDGLDEEDTLDSHTTSVDKPLPKMQLILLCCARVVEPIAFFCIFPFVNQMIHETGDIEPSSVGFYAGLIESLFSLTQMCVMIFWGRAADRFGRKPVLVSSLAGVSVTTALFGLGKSIWQMIMFRCAAGVFAGTIVTIRTMFSEHSTPKTQARAFSWFAFSGNLGIFVGPLIGGALVEPATQYPGVFGKIPFFKEYPYALPTFATGGIAAIAAILCALFVEETLVKKEIDNDSDSVSSNTKKHTRLSSWELLRSPNVAPVIALYGYVMMLAYSYTAVSPVFYYTPIELGGFGFRPIYISLFMGLVGFSQAIWLLIIFPPLQHRFGTGGVLRLCAWAYPFFFIQSPIMNTLLRYGSHDAKTVFWVLAPILLAIGTGVSMAFTGVQLALNDVAPSMETLGTLNALALTLISGLRAVCPAAFTSLFALGIEKQILNGYLIWLVLVLLGIGFVVGVRWLPEKAEGRIVTKPNDEENET